MKSFKQNEIRAPCNVNKFDTFDEYLESFLLEIKECPISSRMIKTRKLKVL